MDPLVIAKCPLNELLAAIGQLTLPFTELPPGTQSVNRKLDGYPVYVGEVNGLAYLVEPDRTFIALCWGLLARVSREVDALVIGAHYDKVEDHCEFFAAQAGELVRAFWDSPPKASRPFELGNPLFSEIDTPFLALAGAGLSEALQSFGFPPIDCLRGFDSLPGERCMAWKGTSVALCEVDEFRLPVYEHIRQYANLSNRPPEAVVRVRGIAG
jgi:hypothetical protein